MARASFDRLDADRQEAILTAAADEFSSRGYEAASMNRIVERAGSSKGALYYYFDDKSDLLATVVQRALDRVLREAEWPDLEELTREDYWERVQEVSRRSMARMEDGTWYMRLLWAFWRLREEPAARAATAGVLDWTRDLTRAFIRHGQTLGVVRDDLPLELLLDMFLAADQAGDRWMMAHWDEMSDAEKSRLFEARVDLARDMLDARHVGWDR